MEDYDSVENQLSTIRDFIRFGMSELERGEVFFGHGTDNALDEATAAVLHVLRLPHDLPGHFMESRLLTSEKKAVLTLIRRRVEERVPMAYLTNEAWFAGLKFFVDQRVLVPRSPIAELIEQQFEPWVEPENVTRILDLCTGSGCIAIACAYQFPHASVDAADISDEALAVAQRNIVDLGVEGQVEAICSDIFSGLKGQYDLIVSNPPYVDQSEIDAMPSEFHHEPILGLASGNDGLDATRRILAKAEDFLNENGVLVVEVGASEEALVAAFPTIPFTWLEFARGGSGVFLLTKDQLTKNRVALRG
ncbi:MAG: 50S ribosomal protein L3 N(5)-glutamine methyltransferase [Gammaproteobacteria bacterium]|nr:50S ribosomal protein L3 N(5)-glutamine methyltransferase [Gammaproteobacteria bacterium]